MLDFWFMVGAAVEDPTLLSQIAKANPVFTKANATLTINGGPPINLPSAGLLDATSTPYIRQQIRNCLVNKFGAITPVISLYAAGKACQLLTVMQLDTAQAIGNANVAFVAATQSQAVTLSQPLLTLMGACLVDPNLSLGITQQQPQELAIASEFGVVPSATSPEWRVIQSWLNQPKFKPAQAQLLASWSIPCREVMVFYGNFQNAAL